MEQEKKKGERTRRQYAPNGERSQKMVTFRCDYEVLDWLLKQPNKGRYINRLIAADMARQQKAKGEEVETWY